MRPIPSLFNLLFFSLCSFYWNQSGINLTLVCGDRWFHEKGFGFIEKADGSGDVFCGNHDVTLQDGARNPKVGSLVELNVADIGKGPRAQNVTQMGGAPCEGGRTSGILTSWDPDEKVGIISTADDDSGDLPVSGDNIWEKSRPLKEGDSVLFDPRDSKSGWYAVYVTLEGTEIFNFQCRFCGEHGHKQMDCPLNKGGLSRVLSGASREQLQYTILQCLKQYPLCIPTVKPLLEKVNKQECIGDVVEE